jgi:cytochrome c-type biogenesis protein CcmH/NrfF
MSDMNNMTPQNQDPESNRNFSEELEVAGSQLVERVKELIDEGNVRRLIIRNPDGRTLVEIPLTVGAAVGGALLLWLGPVIASLAVIGALIARVKIEVVREEPAATVEDVKNKVEDAAKNLSDSMKQ